MGKGVCAITGSKGFLGEHLTQRMKESGWVIKRVGRKNTARSWNEDAAFSFSLGETVDPEMFSDVTLLIHCAYDFRLSTWEEVNEINVNGTRLLFEAAKAAEVPHITYISSMQAFEGCRTMYGKAKLYSERIAFDHGAIVVRPGTIYGEKGGKLYGGQGGNTLRVFEGMFEKSPIFPFPYSGKASIYTSHIDDLCDLIEEAVSTTKVLDTAICGVNKKAYTLKEFLITMRDRRYKKRVLFIPIPWKLIWCVLAGMEAINVKVPLGSESILAFVDQNPNPDFSGIEQFRTRMRCF